MAFPFATLLLAAALGVEPDAHVTPGVTNAGLDTATGFALRTESDDVVREQAYQRLLALDDAAQSEMDQWIREADAAGSKADEAALQKRLNERIAGVERAYREFLATHPTHVDARVAFGSFLHDTGQEQQAEEQWQRARELNPKNPAVYNNLAGLYGHRGPVTNAFVLYEKAIELNPKEAVYYQNFGTTVYLYRRDVMAHYGITDEQKVFDKALGLYRKALELRPDDFIIATDLAQTYYGIKPLRYDDAMTAWQRAYLLAGDDLERQGVRVHLARIQMQAGRLGEARAELGRVTNANYTVVRERMLKTIDGRERGDGGAVATDVSPR
ncbi:MAG: tetratricopeptide repeat protein [Verrucomicrobiales bacterium]|nr:tetratricopeptide repeat protein [Verrucomicrobiales bacterium]